MRKIVHKVMKQSTIAGPEMKQSKRNPWGTSDETVPSWVLFHRLHFEPYRPTVSKSGLEVEVR